uniref:Uncharacterized protein n=1 Tax=Geobacter metallireducens TaxID=28232 RepID=A0A831UE87_GEOME
MKTFTRKEKSRTTIYRVGGGGQGALSLLVSSGLPNLVGRILRGPPSGAVQRADAPEPEVSGREYGAEYERFADRLREAMAGVGTDEEEIYRVLQQVRGRPNGVDFIKKAYRERFGTLLEDDLRSEMSGTELDFALSLLGVRGRTEGAILPQTLQAQDYVVAVERLVQAMKGPGTDEEAIYAALLPFAGAFGRILSLKEAYQKRTGAATINALEEDLRSEMSGDELDYALELLGEPRRPAAGMPAAILAEAARETAPGTPCSVASIKRFMRAYLDVHYLDGFLYYSELLRAQTPGSPEYQRVRELLTEKLHTLLGEELGNRYLDGGPNGDATSIGIAVRDTLKRNELFGPQEGKRLYNFWQIIGNGEDTGRGATEALVEGGIGVAESRPLTGARNIKDVLWDEVLQPGSVIQTWSTVDSATTFACPASKQFGGVCGHSFIFVEYVYAAEAAPPTEQPQTWQLYGGSGTPLTTGGEVESARRPLTEIRNLRLVGLRIVDQRGYHFIPREVSCINSQVLPDNVTRVKWLALSEVWYAARL